MIDKALDLILERMFGHQKPRILILSCTVGRSGLDMATRILARLGAQGIITLIGDPVSSYQKLLRYNLFPALTSIARTARSRFMIVLVDNGLKQFEWRGDNWELIQAKDPDEKGGPIINGALRDGPIIMYAAHALSRGLSLSHVSQLVAKGSWVYVMSQAIEAMCPRGVGDYELIAEFFNKLCGGLCVLASFIDNPAGRETICFWYGFNLDDPNAVEDDIREGLKEAFKIKEEDLHLIGGSNSCPETPPRFFKPKYAFDTKYLVCVLLFGVDPEREEIGPQFEPIKRVWEERRKVESSKLLRGHLLGRGLGQGVVKK